MIYDVIIIGAGPAGLSAALYALRANKKVLVFEKNTFGGQIVNTPRVDNYPGLPHVSGYDFAKNLYDQVKELGCEFVYEEVLEVNDDLEVITSKDYYQARSIIFAVGMEHRKLGLENEDKLIGKGISYCATCDGHFYKDKVCAVVGGGNVALEDALYLSDLCKKVYLIHRRDEFRGERKTLDELKKKKNVEFILSSTVTKIIGEDSLEEIEINNKDLLKVDGLFIAIGQNPQTDLFQSFIGVDSNGFFETNDGVHTKKAHVYVAGDAKRKYMRQLVMAVGDGAQAATIAIHELNNN